MKRLLPAKAQCIFTQHPALMLSCFICVTLSPQQQQGSISWGLIVCCWALHNELLLGESPVAGLWGGCDKAVTGGQPPARRGHSPRQRTALTHKVKHQFARSYPALWHLGWTLLCTAQTSCLWETGAGSAPKLIQLLSQHS